MTTSTQGWHNAESIEGLYRRFNEMRDEITVLSRRLVKAEATIEQLKNAADGYECHFED